VQSQSFSPSQYGSKSSLRFAFMVLVSGSCNSASKLAIHRRYTEHPLLGVPYGSLQGVTVRPVLFHGGNTGSNPVGDANKINDLLKSDLFAEGLKGFDKKKSLAGRALFPHLLAR
jgi:hypothetical protein